MAAAAVLFGVATFLRQSNFLPTPGGDARHQISRGEVTVGAAVMRLMVRTSKTLSPRSGGVVLPVAWVPGSPYCPVRSYIHARDLGPGSLMGELFLLPSTGLPLTTPRLTFLARSVLRTLRWDHADRFTIHSLRRIGARLAGVAGAPEGVLMQHGTWSTLAVRSYVPRRITSAVPAAIASVLADHGPPEMS